MSSVTPPPSSSLSSDGITPPPPSIIPDFQYTASGRMKGKAGHPLLRVGGQYVRTVEMFTLPSVVMKAGINRESAPEDEEYTESENRLFDVWQELINLDPSVLKACTSTKNMADAAHQVRSKMHWVMLQLGASNTKALDTNGIKINIPLWWDKIRPSDSALGPIPNEKSDRGHGNDACHYLLCPVDLDYQDTDILVSKSTINGEPMDGSDYPNFLHSTNIDKDRLWLSFLKGGLLVQAYKHVFTSLSSARVSRESAASSSASTRAGNAQLYGMTSVTKASIAYIATQVMFCLTAYPTFNKTHKSLEAVLFYNSILDYLNDPLFHEHNVALLKWWNLQIFLRYTSKNVNKTRPSAHQQMRDAVLAVRSESPGSNI
ncbi:hypothetical protein CPC08DRAFT_808973 [Agrocybe pediades]|nr:hypothetical protein CPC08DRAFT_808973 [Agrocybe pediades]